MKKVSFLVSLSIGLFAFQCDEAGPYEGCIDPEKINTNQVCTADYNPVCGCDLNTYSNVCVATSAGLLAWTQGACK